MPWHTEHFPPEGVNGVGVGLRFDSTCDDLTGLDFVGVICNVFLVGCPRKGYDLVLGSDVDEEAFGLLTVSDALTRVILNQDEECKTIKVIVVESLSNGRWFC